MNLYLAALDERERQPGDSPRIGLILCRERNRANLMAQSLSTRTAEGSLAAEPQRTTRILGCRGDAGPGQAGAARPVLHADAQPSTLLSQPDGAADRTQFTMPSASVALPTVIGK